MAAWLLAPASHAGGCDFRPPQPALLRDAYADVSFIRQPDNRAIESAAVSKGLRVEISRSQCVDVIVTEITFIVTGDRLTRRDDNAWIDFARSELGHLKLARSEGNLRELQQFLLRARNIAKRDGARAECKDGSDAPAGECSWDSMGGYVVRVKRERSAVRISATEYTSG